MNSKPQLRLIFWRQSECKAPVLLRAVERTGNRCTNCQPTVIKKTDDTALVFTDESFGPIALFSQIGSVDEAIERANEAPQGLATHTFTQGTRDQSAMTRSVEAEMLAFDQFRVGADEAHFADDKDLGLCAESGIEASMATCALVSTARKRLDR